MFATQYNAVMVLTGTMIALTMISIASIYLGKIISKKVEKKRITRIAAITFIVVGISFFLL